jgi:nucleoside phosphorylase
MTTAQRPVDIGIVVALPEEFDELLELARPYTSHHDPDLDAYVFERGSYRCAACLVGDKGEVQAARVTERLVALLGPGSVVVIGITGGVHDDLRVGDVHVPPQAVEYIQDGKAAPTASGGFAVAPGAPAYRADFALLAAVRRFKNSYPDAYERWLGDGRADLATLISDTAVRHRLFAEDLVRPDVRLLADGYVATGPVVGAAAAFSAWIRSHNREVKSLEMESAAVLLTAQARHNPKRALAIRGISDFGDDRKQALDRIGGGSLRQYAMRNAVRLLFALLDAGAWPKESGTQNPR